MQQLGSYTLGRRPIAYHRTSLATPSSLSITIHEQTHQNLSINTTFGVLAQLLTNAASQGRIYSAWTACFEEQWCVQELDAVYAELFVVAVSDPQYFEAARLSLPSAALDEPPYRELFDAIATILPLDQQTPRELSYAHHIIVHAISCLSMQTDCLSHLSNLKVWDEGAFITYLRRESPCARFDLILQELEKDIHKLVKRIAEAAIYHDHTSPFPTNDCDCFELAYETIRSTLSSVPIADARKLVVTQINEAAITLARLLKLDKAMGVRSESQDPSPEFRPTAEELSRLYETLPPRGNGELLRKLMSQAMADGLGVRMSLAMKTSLEVFVQAGCYIFGDPPNPCKGGPEILQKPLPARVNAILDTDEFLTVLEAFPGIPHVVCFIKDSWRFLAYLPRLGDAVVRAVKVAAEPDLSEEQLRQLLEFEQLGSASSYFGLGPMISVDPSQWCLRIRNALGCMRFRLFRSVICWEFLAL
jgi:hypothetical protein